MNFSTPLLEQLSRSQIEPIMHQNVKMMESTPFRAVSVLASDALWRRAIPQALIGDLPLNSVISKYLLPASESGIDLSTRLMRFFLSIPFQVMNKVREKPHERTLDAIWSPVSALLFAPFVSGLRENR